jgi:uncharacterized membrane protein
VISLEHVYVLMGVLLATVAWLGARDRASPKRFNNAGFWGIYAVTFLAGSHLPDIVNGCLVIAMVGIAGIGKLAPGAAPTTSAEQREASAQRWRNSLFFMALIVPVVTVIGALTLKRVAIMQRPLVQPNNATLISLALATLISVAIIMRRTRAPLMAPFQEARRLFDTIGWAAVLPQLLAALGALFAVAGVGQIIAAFAKDWIAMDNALLVVATYTFGMALFTVIMGNAFAAFPVMTAGIGLPLIVTQLGGNPAILASIGMLSGFCGTLMTPMAANFNIVPAALLELPDQNAVIKAQLPTALVLLVANTLLMYFLVFRF